MYTIVCFCPGVDDFGLYVRGYRNEYGTALYARGTLDEILEIRRGM